MKKRICCLFAVLLLILPTLTGCKEKQGTASSVLPRSSSAEAEASAAPSQESAAFQSSTLTPSPTPESTPEPELTERETHWRIDLKYFKELYAQYHTDPFYYVSEEELDWQLEQLAKKVPELSDTDLFFELSKIVAGLGDNHTALLTPDELYSKMFPLNLKIYGDKLYLCGYYEQHSQLDPYMLHEIVSFNGIDIKYLQQKAASLSDPTNYWRNKLSFERWLRFPAFLDWASGGYTDEYTGKYTIEFLDDDQKVVSVELPVLALEDMKGEIVKPENWDKVPSHKRETYVDYFETEKGNYVYFKLYDVMYENDELYHGLMEKAGSLLAEHPGSKLVIDLREDYGGWMTAVDAIKKDIPLLKEAYQPQTYVVTGGNTTSGGVAVLLNFKQEMAAIQVGEPTGQFTSFWGYHTTMTKTMPYSRISFEVGNFFVEDTTENTYYDKDGKLYPWENTILPDVYVSQDIEDVKAGKDSAIEWILEQ